MRNSLSTLLVGAIAAPIFLFATPAAAAPNPCGNIELLTIDSCEIRLSSGCKVDCTPLNFQAACDGQCNGSLDASCTAECNTGCSAQCEAMPARFNCEASCRADCAARVVSQCADDDECKSYAAVDCNANCEGNCSGVLPEAQCSARCGAACNGSCETDANFDCSLQCSVDLKGGCEADCDAPRGALFCDGQFINATSRDECIAYLVSNYGLQLQVSGGVDAGVEPPPPMEPMEESDSGCTTTPGPGSTLFDAGALATMAAGIGLMVSRRRRRS